MNNKRLKQHYIAIQQSCYSIAVLQHCYCIVFIKIILYTITQRLTQAASLHQQMVTKDHKFIIINKPVGDWFAR